MDKQSSPPLSAAEAALDVAESVLARCGKVDLWEFSHDRPSVDYGLLLGRVHLAIDFSRRPRGFQLRALVEGWDLLRLIQEMY